MTLLNPAQIEQAIQALDARLEDETRAFATLSDEAARAEVEWKHAYWRAVVEVAADEKATKVRTNSEYRDAMASIKAGPEKFLAYRVAEERQRAAQSSLATLRSRLDAQRTLAANLRALTTR